MWFGDGGVYSWRVCETPWVYEDEEEEEANGNQQANKKSKGSKVGQKSLSRRRGKPAPMPGATVCSPPLIFLTLPNLLTSINSSSVFCSFFS